MRYCLSILINSEGYATWYFVFIFSVGFCVGFGGDAKRQLSLGEHVTSEALFTPDFAYPADVRITDERSAAFEPVRQQPYTAVVRSLSGFMPMVIGSVVNGNNNTDVYIDRLPRGETEFEYEVTVNNSGTFTTAVATLISGEDPDLTVHSASTVLNVGSNN